MCIQCIPGPFSSSKKSMGMMLVHWLEISMVKRSKMESKISFNCTQCMINYFGQAQAMPVILDLLNLHAIDKNF